MGGIPNSSASRRPTNPPNGGIFHATAVANPDCASADSGKRCGETKNSSFNTPAPTPQHHRAKRTITNNNGTRRRCPLSSKLPARSRRCRRRSRRCRLRAQQRCRPSRRCLLSSKNLRGPAVEAEAEERRQRGEPQSVLDQDHGHEARALPRQWLPRVWRRQPAKAPHRGLASRGRPRAADQRPELLDH